jgi:hypothetical protein
MQRFESAVLNQIGKPIAGASVTVFLTGTGTPATLYSDDGVTSTGNPRSTDSDGRFFFFIADGRYDIQISGTGLTTYTASNIEIADVLEKFGTDGGWVAATASIDQLTVPTFAKFGTNPAATGNIRLPNTGTIIGRNAANSADITMAQLSATNGLDLLGGLWTLTSAGNLIAGLDNTKDIGASGATRPRTGFFGTSVVAPTINATTAFQVNGTPLAASNLSNGVTGTGAVVLAASPTMTGTIGGGTFNATAGFQIASVALAASHLSNGVTGTGAVVLASGPTLSGLLSYVRAAVTVNTVTFSATPTFNASLGDIQKITLTGNVTSSTFSNASTGQLVTFMIAQDGVGGRTFVWPTNVKNAPNISGTISAVTAYDFIFDGTNAYYIGQTSAGTGTVTSVALSLPAELTVTGSPVTTSGTLGATWATQLANKVFAGPPSGGAVAPAFRSLVNADLPATIDATTGYTVAGAAASGKILRGDGTKFATADDVRSVTVIIGADNGSALADADDQLTIWRNNLGRTYRIAEVWAECDAGSPIINLQRDDGTPANILSSNLTVASTGGTGTIAAAEQDLASGDRIDFTMVTAGGTAKRITINIQLVAQ